ncbi:MAG TPA: L,D-transpeptidase [Nordella sp.]|nr:L,D-transpeptidase [Nordella sp.]
MHRRLFLSALASSLGAAAFPGLAEAAKQSRQRQPYRGAEFVYFDSYEQPGTIIVDTGKRALFYIVNDSEAVRYGVAVGKDGFSWAGIAKIGRKTEWPRWTPPTSMIKRKPELAKFASGMPGGPDNPLGARALYLFDGGRDTLFRIHGTNEPQSIGTAASSGCIRMLNEEVTELYEKVPVGTKVIVL